MTHSSRALAILAGGMLLFSAIAWGAINRGKLQGTVTDPQGSVVPGAKVVVRNQDTGVELNLTTNSSGYYIAIELVPGKYAVDVAVQGFVAEDVTNIEVKADDTATADVRLQIGRVAQHVEVTAANPLVETTPTNVAVSVEQSYMQNLPILGRDIQSLVQMIPGVTQSSGPPGALVGFNGGEFGGFPDPSHVTGSQLSVNGGQTSSNAWYLDGSLNSAEGTDNAVVNPPPDAVAEFRVVTGQLSAEYARTAGAVFSVVLKSGGNKLHGTLSEFNRNSFASARNPFGALGLTGKPLPPNYANWNQFGGTVGGPVYLPHIYNGKNRTFFFAAWDISKLEEKAPGAVFTIPTLKERQGDFSEFPSIVQYGIYDPLSTKYSAELGSFTRQPFLNPDGTLAHIIPANRLDKVAMFFMNQFPTPNYLDPRQQNAAAGGCLNTCNNYLGNYGSKETTNESVLKVDHEINDKNKLFVEWLFNPTSYPLYKLPWVGATVPLEGFGGSTPFDVANSIGAAGITTVFSPTLINEFRFAVSRQSNIPLGVANNLQNVSGAVQALSGLNIPFFPPYQQFPSFNVGSTYWGPPNGDNVQVQNAWNYQDNVTKVKGKHTIKAGFMFRNDQIYSLTTPRDLIDFNTGYGSSGAYSIGLTTNPVTGLGGSPWAQFALGAVDQNSEVLEYPDAYASIHTWNLFVQDDYRITPNLTLSLGVRYDRYGWFSERHCRSSEFDFNAPNPEDPLRIGAIAYFGTSLHPSCLSFPAHPDDFSPRVNFAWAPFGNRKTVVRGGYDLIYTNGNTSVNGELAGSQDPGYGNGEFWDFDATNQGYVGSGQVPAFILSQGAPSLPPFETVAQVKQNIPQFLGPLGNINGPVQDTRDPNVTVWNLQVERQLPWNLGLTVGYVGSEGMDLAGGNRQYNFVPDKDIFSLRNQLNELVPTPADLVPYWGSQYFAKQFLKPYPQYSSITAGQTGKGANSSYNALQVKVEKRFSNGLNFLAAYTNQKTIDTPGNLGGYFSNLWTGGNGAGQGRGRMDALVEFAGVYDSQDEGNYNADRAVSGEDTPQIFNIAWSYELPVGPGRALASGVHGVARQVVQGWRISMNYNAQSGIPMIFTGPSNNITSRPNLIGNPGAGRRSKTRYEQEQQWYNPAAFEAVFGSDPTAIALATSGTPAQQAAYTENGAYPFWQYGTAGFRLPQGRTPGFSGADAALSKDFRFTSSEDKYLQFRMEMYNAFNHQSLGLPTNGARTADWCLPPNPDGSTDAVHQFGCQFGRIDGVQSDPRTLQFAAKFIF